MVTFGRKAGTKVGIPSNRGLGGRANRQLEGIAVSQAEKFENALGVDAPLFYFWKNSDGSMPCTCSAARRGPNRDIDPGGMTKFEATAVTSSERPDFELVNTGDYGDSSLSDMFGDSSRGRRATSKEKIETDTYDDPSMSFDAMDDEINEIDSMDVNSGITGFDDPLNLFGAKIIDCAICMGAGYIDAWNPYGGKRFVFDTTNAYDFDSQGIEIDDDSNPNRMITTKSAKAFWQFKLPLAWNRILRINVYNGIEIVPAHTYRWVFQDEQSVIQVVTEQSLEALNGTGQLLKLSLAFNEADIAFTHAEIVFIFTEARHAQIPEIEQGYEQEFLDWNVNLTVELPPDLNISEGDYLTESKYRKVWKVSTLTRKVTMGGVTYGLSANLRALHSFEKDFVQLALFKTNYNTSGIR